VGAQTLSHSDLMAGGAQLWKAAKRGDTAEVRRLVRSGANVDGGGDYIPLHYAAEEGRAETVKALLELGATVDGLHPRWSTPLHAAARFGHAGDILMLPQQALQPMQFHAPTQRREGRVCVPHDCGGVCACARVVEQGARTERRYCKPYS
jgi:hypothetical protein